MADRADLLREDFWGDYDDELNELAMNLFQIFEYNRFEDQADIVNSVFAAIECGKSVDCIQRLASHDDMIGFDTYGCELLGDDGIYLNEKGQTPAMVAAQYGRMDVIVYLMVELPLSVDREFDLELWSQQIRPSLQTHLQEQQPVSQQDVDDDVTRALIRCCSCVHGGIVPVAQFLVEEAGANILASTSDLNRTALDLACEHGHYDLVVYLAQTERGREAVHSDDFPHVSAAVRGHYRIAQHLIEAYQVDVSREYSSQEHVCAATTLHAAILGQDSELPDFEQLPDFVMSLLSQRGAEQTLDILDDQGRTPVICVLELMKENSPQLQLCWWWDVYEFVLQILLDAGADANIPSANNRLLEQTPLHLACQANFTDGVDLLLECGAKINTADASGNTPLLISLQQRSLPIMKRLLQEPDIQVNYVNNKNGHSALTLATCQNSSWDFVHLLLEQGASITQTRGGWGALVVASRKKTNVDKLYLLVKAFCVQEQNAAGRSTVSSSS